MSDLNSIRMLDVLAILTTIKLLTESSPDETSTVVSRLACIGQSFAENVIEDCQR